MVQPKESPRGRTLASGTILLLSLGTKSLTNLILVRLALQALPAEPFRLWVVLQSLVAYLSLSEIGLGQTTMNYQGASYAQGDNRRVNQVLFTALGLYFALIFIVAVLGCLAAYKLPFAHWLLNHPSENAVRSFPFFLFIFGTLTLLSIPTTVMGATLSGLRDHPIRQGYELGLPVATLVFVALALHAGGGLWALLVIPPTLQLFWGWGAYPILRARHPFIRLSFKNWSKELAPKLISNSAFFFLISLATVMHRSIGNLLTSRFGTTTEVAQVFGLFALFRVLGWSLIDIVSRVLQPYIILFAEKKERERILFFAGTSHRVSWVLSLAFAAFLFLFGRRVLEIWLGIRQFIGQEVLGLIVLCFLFDVFSLPFFNVLVAMNRHRRLACLTLVHAVMSFVLGRAGVALSPQAPLLGMFSGFLIASLVAQGLLMPLIVARELELSFPLFFLQFLLKPLLVFLGISLLLGVFTFRGTLAFVPCLALESLVLVSLAYALWYILLCPEERAFFLTFIRRGRARVAFAAEGSIG